MTKHGPTAARHARAQRAAEMQAAHFGNAHQNDGFRLLPPSAGVDDNWHVTNDNDTCVAHCFGFNHDVARGKDLAVRIAAALNYCQHIDTAELVSLSADHDTFAVLSIKARTSAA